MRVVVCKHCVNVACMRVWEYVDEWGCEGVCVCSFDAQLCLAPGSPVILALCLHF